jgi:predicted DNA-binding transcriptional regulator AlpA
MLSEKEVAAILGVSVAVLRKWRRFEVGPTAYRIGPSLIRYKPAEVDAFIEDGKWRSDARQKRVG